MRWFAPIDTREDGIMVQDDLTRLDRQAPTRVILEQAGGWGRWGTRLAGSECLDPHAA